MIFFILGTGAVGDSADRSTVIRASKKKALLAILLLNANEWVSTETLIDALWGDDPPSSAVGSIKTYIWSLRQHLPLAADNGRRIETRSQAYRIRAERSELDLFMFEDLLNRGRRHLLGGEPDAAVEALAAGLGLWQGVPLPDVPGSFGDATRLKVADQRLTGYEDLLEAKLALGLHAEVVGEAQVLLSENRFRERAWWLYLLALYRSDRQVEAVLAYRTLHQQFVDELGMEPGAELAELHQAILNRAPWLDAMAVTRLGGTREKVPWQKGLSAGLR